MTKRALLGVAVALLLAIPVASAHPSPDPRTFETRLLHDCVDDVPGSHDGNIIGYDLHSLDIWEFWDGTTEMVGFRAIVNGNGGATVTVSFDLDGTATSYGWTSNNGDEWTVNGFDSGGRQDDVYLDDSSQATQDGDRFALMGHIARSTLGGIDAMISAFVLASDSNLGVDDRIPGDYNGGECEDAFERPDYTIGEKTSESAYLSEPISDDDVALDAGTQELIDVVLKSKVKSLRQQVTMEIVSLDGDATARFHDPQSGEYSESAATELKSQGNPGSQKTIHLALEAPEGASGTVTIEITTHVVLKDGTTQPGARVVRAIDYEVVAPDTPTPTEEPTSPPDGGTGDGRGIPAPSVLFASVGLLAAAAWRRR